MKSMRLTMSLGAAMRGGALQSEPSGITAGAFPVSSGRSAQETP